MALATHDRGIALLLRWRPPARSLGIESQMGTTWSIRKVKVGRAWDIKDVEGGAH